MVPNQHGFSFWVTVAFTLNYILGSGFLTLPRGFARAGVFLGVLVLLIFGFFCTLSVFFILEAIYRGQRLIKYAKESGIELRGIPNARGYVSIQENTYVDSTDSKDIEETKNPIAADDESDGFSEDEEEERKPRIEFENVVMSAERSQRSSFGSLDTMGDNPLPVSHLDNRKLEIVELSGLFLGHWGQQIYTLVIIVYMYGTLWAYATVFANAFASHLSIGESSYVLYLLAFALLVVPVSLVEFTEQVSVQVTLSIFRILMVSVMVITCLIALYEGDDEFGIVRANSDSVLWKFSPNKLQYLLPTAAFAYIFHHSVPSLAHSTKDQEQKRLTTLFQVALIISAVAYILVGSVLAVNFGNNINASSNLNWSFYRGVSCAPGESPKLYAKIIAFFVVLFPAVDVASAYPLNAYTLGNNLMSAYYGQDMHKHDSSLWKLRFFRALAAAPPLLGALKVRELGKITDYTGLTAFALAFIFPPLLARYSALALQAQGLPTQTPHSSFWTTEPFQYLLGVSGIVLLVVVFACLLATSDDPGN